MTTSKKSAVSMKEQRIIPDNLEREQWIEESAYFMSEARGFTPGYEQDDWNAAEKKYDNSMAA